MRKVALLTALFAVVFGAVGVAYADITATPGLTVKTTGKKGTKAKPSALKLAVTTTATGSAANPDGTYGTKQAVVHFDKNIKFNNAKFPTCTAFQIAKDATACPKGSMVGSGTADAQVNPKPGLQLHPIIDAYNGPSGQFFLQLKKGPGDPVDPAGVLTAKLAKDTGKYGSKLIVTIPKSNYYNLGLAITLTRFFTKIDATTKKGGKSYPYVVSTGCTGGKYNFGADFTYVQVDKDTQAESTTVASTTATSKC